MVPNTTWRWVAVALGAMLTVQSPQLQPEIRDRAQQFFDQLASFERAAPETLDKLRLETYTPEFQGRMSAERNRQVFMQIRESLGKLTLTAMRPESGNRITMLVTGSTGERGRVTLRLEPTPPYRIAGYGLAVGEDESPAADPPVTGSMDRAQLEAALHPFLEKQAQSGSFAGVVLVGRAGAPVFERAYGLASRESNTPNTPDTRFDIGSLTKTMTRAAIAQLVDQGKLALTDTVGKILPQYPNKDAQAATVEQLLDHRVGIADIFDAEFKGTPRSSLRSNADYLQMIAAKPLGFLPGAEQKYCNGCYVVLGAMIERVTGVRYEDYIAKNIFARANMRDSGFTTASAPNVAMSYTQRDSNGAVRASRGDFGIAGNAAGGSYSTARDLLAFNEALRSGKLLGPKMTAWYFNGKSIERGRAAERMLVSGGADGVSASTASDADWQIVVLANLDPPAASNLAAALMKKLGA